MATKKTLKTKKLTLPADSTLTADHFAINKSSGNVTIKDEQIKNLLATQLTKAKNDAGTKAVAVGVTVDF